MASKPINIRWIKLVLSQTEKPCTARELGSSANRTGFNIIILYFNIRSKLSIMLSLLIFFNWVFWKMVQMCVLTNCAKKLCDPMKWMKKKPPVVVNEASDNVYSFCSFCRLGCTFYNSILIKNIIIINILVFFLKSSPLIFK